MPSWDNSKCTIFALHLQHLFITVASISCVKKLKKNKSNKSNFVWVLGGCDVQCGWEWQSVSTVRIKVISIFLMPCSLTQVDRLKERHRGSKELSACICVTLPVCGCCMRKSLSTSVYDDINTTNKGHSCTHIWQHILYHMILCCWRQTFTVTYWNTNDTSVCQQGVFLKMRAPKR